MASWSLVTRLEVQSLNAIIRWKANRMSWRYAKERDLWRRLFAQWQMAQRIPDATSRRRLRIVRVYAGRQRAFDGDNMAGAKLVIDALKPRHTVAHDHKVSAGGLLVDDNAAGLVLELDQRRGEIACTEITLEDA